MNIDFFLGFLSGISVASVIAVIFVWERRFKNDEKYIYYGVTKGSISGQTSIVQIPKNSENWVGGKESSYDTE